MGATTPSGPPPPMFSEPMAVASTASSAHHYQATSAGTLDLDSDDDQDTAPVQLIDTQKVLLAC